MNELLDMLESLLSITEPYKGQMSGENLKNWQRISARTADLRLMEEDCDENGDSGLDESMDGDHESGLASAGFGMDEDYD